MLNTIENKTTFVVKTIYQAQNILLVCEMIPSDR